MTNDGLFHLFLVIHVITAIAAFGPSFAFPLITGMSRAEPPHGNFAARVIDRVERKLVVPGALTMPISGALMIYFAQIDLFATSTRWLLAGIVLYVIAISYAILVQIPTIDRIIHITSTPPPPGVVPAGPPPGLLQAAEKAKRGGILLSVLIVTIVTLMVVRPGV